MRLLPKCRISSITTCWQKYCKTRREEMCQLLCGDSGYCTSGISRAIEFRLCTFSVQIRSLDLSRAACVEHKPDGYDLSSCAHRVLPSPLVVPTGAPSPLHPTGRVPRVAHTWSRMFRSLQPKALLCRVLRSLLPEKVTWRRKMGFHVPLAAWFR